MNQDEVPGLRNPFPGLRPFSADEADLFFGRDRLTDELLRRLGRQRLLAVIGTSGSGKSSLLRAGLIPSLESGFMSAAGSSWRIVGLRPQSDPIGSLSAALVEAGGLKSMALDSAAAQGILETTLRRSTIGLIDAARLLELGPRENLLVFVDQFEELFRYADLARERGSADDAVSFVQLLLHAATQSESPIYVAITMRSDFLGDCARFRGLAEAVSDGQYLIPRLSRDELRQAIVGPVGVRGGRIDEALVQRLLNDVGDDPDQLPVLQHALMRAWNHWAKAGDLSRSFGLNDLVITGGLAEALSRHADQIWNVELNDVERILAARMFRCLTDRVAGPREIRRPTALGTLETITGSDSKTLARVIEVFRAPGRSFLMPPHGVPLHSHTEIDISHESLLRKWARLRGWIQAEWESRTMYLRLVEAAELHEAGEAGLWEEPALGHALRWLENAHPSQAWADRYAPGLGLALSFLKQSQRASDQRRAREAARAKEERAAAERELTQAQQLAALQLERAEEQQQLLVEQRGRQLRERYLAGGAGLILAMLLVIAVWGLAKSRIAEDAARYSEAQAVAKDAVVKALEAVELERKRADEQAKIAEDRLERMIKIIKRIPDLKLRSQLTEDYLPSTARELTRTQKERLEARIRTVDNGAAARPRLDQPQGFKLWRNGSVLHIGFVGGSADQRAFVRRVAVTWLRYANLKFEFDDPSNAEIRVAFKDEGNWSFIGTDALGIPDSEPTINFAWLDEAAVLHEFGHVLGLIHENTNPNARLPWNREAVFGDMASAPYFWDRATVEHNLFGPSKISGYRAFDVNSIMLYEFPGRFFTDRIARGGAKTLSDSDKAFARQLYPPN